MDRDVQVVVSLLLNAMFRIDLCHTWQLLEMAILTWLYL